MSFSRTVGLGLLAATLTLLIAACVDDDGVDDPDVGAADQAPEISEFQEIEDVLDTVLAEIISIDGQDYGLLITAPPMEEPPGEVILSIASFGNDGSYEIVSEIDAPEGFGPDLLSIPMLNTRPLALDGTDLYVPLMTVGESGNALWVVDVSDPEDPSDSVIEEQALSWQSFVISRDIMFFGQPIGGLRAFEAAGEDGFEQLGDSVSVQGAEWVPELALDQDRDLLFASHSNGFSIFDVSDPSNLVEVGTYQHDGWSNGESFQDVALYGDFAYLSGQTEEILVVDYSDPAEPVLAEIIDRDDATMRLTESDGFLFVMGIDSPGPPEPGNLSIEIYDLDDPRQPEQIERIEDLGEPSGAEYPPMRDLLIGETTAILYLGNAYFADIDWIEPEGDDARVDAEPSPSPTPTEDAADEPDEVAADIPCEVRELEPPRDDAPETDPERVREWQETAMSFNDVTIGQDGRFYIGSYRHGSILVLDEDRELVDVWSEGTRNRQTQIETHPDGRILLLQDAGLHIYSPDGQHEKYISMRDFDAEFIPQYFGLGVTSQGHFFIGFERGEGLIQIDEDCEVLGHWPSEDGRAPLMVAVDDEDLTYSVALGLGEGWIEIRDTDGILVEERHIEAPVSDAMPVSVTDLPDGGLALLWVIEAEPELDPQSRIVEDFVVQHFAADGELIQEWYASDSGAPELLSAPRGMTIEDDGTMHIVDQGVGPDWMRMHSFSPDGEFLDEWRLDSDQELCGLIDDEARIGGC